MRYLKTIILLSLAACLIIAAGCSGSSATSPDINFDRLATGNGPGNCPGPNGPGPQGHWGDFEYDTARYFDVDYLMTSPNGKEVEATGQIIIYDADGASDESEIRVRFFVQMEGMDGLKCLRMLPGTKTVSDEGTLYSWEFLKEHSKPNHSFEFSVEYQLLVVEGDPDNIIEGWLNRHKSHWWTLPNGKEKEKEWDWNLDINGVETFPED